MAFLLFSTYASASIAVLYPEMRDPYREVITSIIDGIRMESGHEVVSYEIGDSYKRDALRDVLLRDNAEVIIALGRGGFAAAQELKLDLPIIVGALIITPHDVSSGVYGISLAADPELLFKKLKAISPQSKTIHVVYNRGTSEWLVGLGLTAARRLGLSLQSYPVNDSRAAAKVYRDILAKGRQPQDAIWLLPDPASVEDRVILPLILKGAWDNYIAVFSTNPSHAKRGALFSLFPDNKAMGISLTRLAQSILSGDRNLQPVPISPLKDLQAAVNTRSADHLGLVIPIEMQRDFALSFPAP